MRIHLSLAFAAAILCSGAASSLAATDTATFNSQLIITAECKIQTASMMNFGSYGILDANVDTTSTIGVQCTNNTTYTISLDDGADGGTTAVRTMENGALTEDIAYIITKDNGYSQNWGDAGTEILGNPVPLVGNGAIQNHTVYGRVTPQTTPTPNTYTDMITITVTYP